MASVYNNLSNWARRTTTSFGELLSLPAQETEDDDDGLTYRLKHWPDLPCEARTAPVLRTLSVMSHRAVNRRWILVTSKLKASEVDRLLQRLVKQDAVFITDISQFPTAANAPSLQRMAGARA